jgi:hypothetical protein
MSIRSFRRAAAVLQLFGEGDTPQERDSVMRQTTSLLDLVSERTKALEKTLGPGDRAVLNNYLETVREIERRLEKSKARDLSTGRRLGGVATGCFP